MEKKEIAELFKKYNLTAKDWFQHKHYQIITRQGIDKIQAKEKIFIEYIMERCESDFCVVKAMAEKGNVKIQTFGSAKYGGKIQNPDTNKWEEIGNTTTWYIAEMAEKRAMSRAVLKITGFYEHGIFGEDESEDFKRKNNNAETTPPVKPKPIELDDAIKTSLKNAIGQCKTIAEVTKMWNANKEMHGTQFFIDEISKRGKELKNQNN